MSVYIECKHCPVGKDAHLALALNMFSCLKGFTRQGICTMIEHTSKYLMSKLLSDALNMDFHLLYFYSIYTQIKLQNFCEMFHCWRHVISRNHWSWRKQWRPAFLFERKTLKDIIILQLVLILQFDFRQSFRFFFPCKLHCYASRWRQRICSKPFYAIVLRVSHLMIHSSDAFKNTDSFRKDTTGNVQLFCRGFLFGQFNFYNYLVDQNRQVIAKLFKMSKWLNIVFSVRN